jgi:hypothetical protein
VGNRAVPGKQADFLILGAGGGATITGLPDFVHTKGTLFLLLPSQSPLRQWASQGA